VNIRDLQAQLPWTIPYSADFRHSQSDEGHRHLIHDVLHTMKSLGKIAAVCERIDHQGPVLHSNTDPERAALAAEAVDLVICALHIAKTNPFGPFDLEAAVLAALDRRNGSNLSGSGA
jgi:hypothetical protein